MSFLKKIRATIHKKFGPSTETDPNVWFDNNQAEAKGYTVIDREIITFENQTQD
ncbi:MAG: hypothetical protein LBC12_00475 [Nitrososphaerota archaeon]|nr:hypothetical protein [Nitrososphaerota archaeon]